MMIWDYCYNNNSENTTMENSWIKWAKWTFTISLIVSILTSLSVLLFPQLSIILTSMPLLGTTFNAILNSMHIIPAIGLITALSTAATFIATFATLAASRFLYLGYIGMASRLSQHADHSNQPDTSSQIPAERMDTSPIDKLTHNEQSLTIPQFNSNPSNSVSILPVSIQYKSQQQDNSNQDNSPNNSSPQGSPKTNRTTFFKPQGPTPQEQKVEVEIPNTEMTIN